MANDFLSGPAGARFPHTQVSAVRQVGSDDPVTRARAFDVLVRAYWKPAYAHVRVRWNRPCDQAADLVQGFFARAFEKHYLGGFNPDKAHFRTFLKVCLDRFVMEQDRDERRLKRGGQAVRLSLDFASAEDELQRLSLPSSPAEVDRCFEGAWIRHLFSVAVAELEEKCTEQGKETHFRLFERYALCEGEKPSYGELGSELKLTVTQVTNYLAWTRREFRRIVLARLREITATDQEYRHEARAVLGIDP